MPFNSGGQTYQGGNFLYGGLSNFGANLGEGATKAIADMRKPKRISQQITSLSSTPRAPDKSRRSNARNSSTAHAHKGTGSSQGSPAIWRRTWRNKKSRLAQKAC